MEIKAFYKKRHINGGDKVSLTLVYRKKEYFRSYVVKENKINYRYNGWDFQEKTEEKIEEMVLEKYNEHKMEGVSRCLVIGG